MGGNYCQYELRVQCVEVLTRIRDSVEILMFENDMSVNLWVAVADWLACRLLKLQFAGLDTGGATWPTRNNLK